MEPGKTRCVSIAGVEGMPADSSAAVITATVTQPQGDGYLVVNGNTGPLDTRNSSNLNFRAGQDVANSVTTLLYDPSDTASPQYQSICAVSTVATHLVLDVNAVYSESAGTGMLVPLSPVRLDDTRSGTPVPAGTVHEVAVAGRAGVPPDSTSVAVNLTVIDPDEAGYATLFPCGQAVPSASNANFVAGQTVAAGTVVKVGVGGTVCVVSSATAHFALDVSGACSEAAGHNTVYPLLLASQRTADSRPAGVEGAPASGWPCGTSVPNTTTAVVVNVTIDQPAAAGHATVYPCHQPVPEASNVNFAAGHTVTNAVTVALGVDGDICVFTSATAQVIVDQTFAFVPEE